MNSTVEDDEMYAWLTEELGWTPQEAYQELTQAKEEPDYRAPEGPQEQPDAIRGTLQANEAMKAEEAALTSMYKAGSQPRVGMHSQGQVMPTSRGFMYVGAPPPPPSAAGSGYDRMKSAGMIVPPREPMSPTAIDRTPEYNRFEAQEQYKAAVRGGYTPQKAFELYGPSMLQGSVAAKPVHVGDSLVDPVTRTAVYTAPPKQVTAFQQQTIDRWKRDDAAKVAALDISKRKAANQISPAAMVRIRGYEAELASIRKQMETEVDPNKVAALFVSFNTLWGKINQELPSDQAPVAAPSTVKSPGTSTDSGLVTVTNPSGKTVQIRRSQLDAALAQGYKQ